MEHKTLLISLVHGLSQQNIHERDSGMDVRERSPDE